MLFFIFWLTIVGSNYPSKILSEFLFCLEDDLYKFTKKHFRIKFIHDGTAMAAAFKEYENSVCISLGTHFGVGFPL